MKEVIFKSIKDVFESKSLKLDKEPKITSGRAVDCKRLFISCKYDTPYQVRKFFHRPHSTAFNLIPRINLTDKAFNVLASNVMIETIHGTQNASVEVMYYPDREESIEIHGNGAFSGYVVLWRGRLSDFQRYLSDHQSVTAKCSPVKISFTGRKEGAIGSMVNYKILANVSSYYRNTEDIRKLLYEKGYEHITDLKVTWVAWNHDIETFKEIETCISE